jgi:hypothetical protein
MLAFVIGMVVAKAGMIALGFGIVLAMAVIILAITTWPSRDLAAPIPPTEPIYQLQHLNVY